MELYETDESRDTHLLTAWDQVGGGRELLAGRLQFLFINGIKFTQMIILRHHQSLPLSSPDQVTELRKFKHLVVA